MKSYEIEVVMTKRYIVTGRDEDEACDWAFTEALEIVPTGYEVSDVKVIERGAYLEDEM